MSAAGEMAAAVRVPVAHRLFTNAPGEDGGAGFRHLRIGALADGARVEGWLESLRPAADGGVAWAGGAFRLGGVLHLAIARVDGAFRPDEHGRGRGHLAHALVAAAGEDEPDRDLAGRLVEAAQRLARPAGERGDLDTLAGGCASLAGVECRAIERWWRRAADLAAGSGGAAGGEAGVAGFLALAAGGGATGSRPGAARLAAAVLAASAEEPARSIEVPWFPPADGPGAPAAAAAAAGSRPAGATEAPRPPASGSRPAPPAARAARDSGDPAAPAAAADPVAATAAAGSGDPVGGAERRADPAASRLATTGSGAAVRLGASAGAVGAAGWGAADPGAANPATAAAALVAAGQLLPPRLRLALRWSVAARPLPADRLRVILTLAPRPSAPPPPALAGPAAAYAGWLRERLAAGDGAAVAAVAGDWRIRSWRHLVERLGAAVAR